MTRIGKKFDAIMAQGAKALEKVPASFAENRGAHVLCEVEAHDTKELCVLEAESQDDLVSLAVMVGLKRVCAAKPEHLDLAGG